MRRDFSLRLPTFSGCFFTTVGEKKKNEMGKNRRRYEHGDWLSNVRVVVSDARVPVRQGGVVKGYRAEVVDRRDYYSYGQDIGERRYSVVDPYRYSFNGKEDVGEQRWWQDYGARLYHRGLGRFVSADPLIVGGKRYAWLSSYQFASGNSVMNVDLDGLEGKPGQLLLDEGGRFVTAQSSVYQQTVDRIEHSMTIPNRFLHMSSQRQLSPYRNVYIRKELTIDLLPVPNDMSSFRWYLIIERAPWIPIAEGELGQAEIRGPQYNARIIEYHATTTLGAQSDETAWCSSFANWVMKEAGYRGTGSARALDWARWGREVNTPVLGSLGVIRWPNGGGHVGFVVGRTRAGSLVMLGGNQGDRVSYMPVSPEVIISYRLPRDYFIPPGDSTLPVIDIRNGEVTSTNTR